HARLFDRPARAYRPGGGRRSAPASSRPALRRACLGGDALPRPTAGDGLAAAQSDPGRPAHDRPRAGSAPARTAPSRPRCDGGGARRLVGGAPRTTPERGDAVAGDAPAGRDAENQALAASERDAAARAAWRAAGATRDPAPVVVVAESGTHTALTRRYGW